MGVVGSIYCVFLGIKIAKSDEQNSRQKAKQDLIGAIVGFLIMRKFIDCDVLAVLNEIMRHHTESYRYNIVKVERNTA